MDDGMRVADFPAGPPLFQVVVDTEEEFDWGAPFDRGSVGVRSMAAQHRAQALFAPYGVRPTYVIDHPVATTGSSVAVLRGLLDAGACQVGAHLHPWVNPPFEEEVCALNSYPGNLGESLERRKLAALTDAIAESLGERPTMYKAGRYGVGPHTAATLRSLGYLVDLSVVPEGVYTGDGGPDFRGYPGRPYWFGEELFEVPLSSGYSGLMAGQGAAVRGIVESGLGRRVRLGGVLSRLGLLERATLTPEGVDFAAHRRLVMAMLKRGHRVFTMTYHSPSLEPGHTPYVRNAADLVTFLDGIKRVLALFFEELGAVATTPLAVRAMAMTVEDRALQSRSA